MISYDEALEQYYILKSNYENEVQENKKNILKNNNLSKREKRMEYLKLKPKCINCERPVGSIFKTVTTSQEGEKTKTRNLVAICGDRENPCSLKITLNSGIVNSYMNVIEELENDIKKTKENIILSKNKLLFGYIDEEIALAQFDKYKEEIKDLSTLLNYIMSEYTNVTDNKEKKKMLDQKTSQSYQYIKSIQECMSNFNAENNSQFVVDAVNIYINNLRPLLKEIMGLKYSNYLVEHDDKQNSCVLIQQKNTISQLNYVLEEPKVIDFRFGEEKRKRREEEQRKEEQQRRRQQQEEERDQEPPKQRQRTQRKKQGNMEFVQEQPYEEVDEEQLKLEQQLVLEGKICPSALKTPENCVKKSDFMKQARIFHPDKNTDCPEIATKKFQILQKKCANVI